VRRGLTVFVMTSSCAMTSSCGAFLPAEPASDADASAGTDASSAAEAGDDGAGADAGADADASPSACVGSDCERVVFVTNAQFFPQELGSVAGGDKKCTDAAAASKHPRVMNRKFRAWLSASLVPSSPSTELAKGMKPYVRPDGAVIAANWSQFASASHGAAINLDENGVLVDGTIIVWTGTNVDGSATGQDCGGWSTKAAGFESTTGEAGQSNALWSNEGTDSCDTNHRIYCVEE
jgi:hypothetical protein